MSHTEYHQNTSTLYLLIHAHVIDKVYIIKDKILSNPIFNTMIWIKQEKIKKKTNMPSH